MLSVPTDRAGPPRLNRQGSSRSTGGKTSATTPSRQNSTRDSSKKDPSKSPSTPDGARGPCREDAAGSLPGQSPCKGTERQGSTKSRQGPWWLNEAAKAKHMRRVEEMEIWRPENDIFKETEYWRRRDARRRQMKLLETDKRLVRWKKLYIPAFLAMTVGFSLSLTCSVRGLGEGTFLWTHRMTFQVMGFSVLGLGLLLLMLAAGATYYVEDQLRRELGLPPIFVLAGYQGAAVADKVKGGVQVTSASEAPSAAKNRARGFRLLTTDSNETSAFLDSSLTRSTTAEASPWPPESQSHAQPARDRITCQGRLLGNTLRPEFAGQRSMSVESENSSGYSTGFSDSGRGGDSMGHLLRLAPFSSGMFARNGFQRLSEPDTSLASKSDAASPPFVSCTPCRLGDVWSGGGHLASSPPGSAVRCSPNNLRFGPRDGVDPSTQVPRPPDTAVTLAIVTEDDSRSALPIVTEDDARSALPIVTEDDARSALPIAAFPAKSDSGGREGGPWECLGGQGGGTGTLTPQRLGVTNVVIHAHCEDYV